MNKKILLVDDEPEVLKDLEAKLTGRVIDWDFVFADNAKAAGEMILGDDYDVIVIDTHLPEMAGPGFLKRVAAEQPEAIRIIASDHPDPHQVIQRSEEVHQYLSKPYDSELLVHTIKRLFELREELNSLPLQQLVHRINHLPSLPSLYIQVMAELRSSASSLARVGRIISQDIGMTTKILQLANSAYFGLRERVSDPGHAAAILGINTITSLILSNDILSQFDPAKLKMFKIEEVWKHSLLTAFCSREIARSEHADEEMVDAAFLGGFLHDVGKLLIAENMTNDYKKVLALVRDEGIVQQEAERMILGASHAEIGGYLLGIWGIPDPVVEAVLRHHWPSASRTKGFAPLTAVHAANAIVQALVPPDSDPDIDSHYLSTLGMLERIPRWREICLGVIQASADEEAADADEPQESGDPRPE